MRLVTSAAARLPADIDLVIGVPRSGMLAATMIALTRNLPLATPESLSRGTFLGGAQSRVILGAPAPAESQRAILVDDSVYTGNAIRAAKLELSNRLDVQPTTLAVFVAPGMVREVDISLEVCPMPRMFEWNWMHHSDLSSCCVDIDGVLCEDPEEWQNDDSSEYLKFLRDAKPKFLTSRKIGWLVTSRLERYREETEAWLSRHGIEYRRLVMSSHRTQRDRLKAGDHALRKAQAYRESQMSLFIESDAVQSESIANLAAKPVYCPTARRFITPAGLAAVRQDVMRTQDAIALTAHRIRAAVSRRLRNGSR